MSKSLLNDKIKLNRMNKMDPDKKTLLYTVVDLIVHAVVTSVLAVFFYYRTDSWVWPVLSIAGGILIDVDHFIDYFLYFGPRFSIMSFLRHEYQASGKCYVFFHSWEIMAVLWIISILAQWIIPLAAGMTCHMAIDGFISHRKNLMFLSLIYRWVHDFRIMGQGESKTTKQKGTVCY